MFWLGTNGELATFIEDLNNYDDSMSFSTKNVGHSADNFYFYLFIVLISKFVGCIPS